MVMKMLNPKAQDYAGVIPWLLTLWCLVTMAIALQGQIVINEVLPTGTIELKNVGSSTVDVSSYWLCQFPNYQRLDNLDLDCGDLTMEPGEILAVNNFNAVNNPADGEVGLYLNNNFGSADAILDYVEWGTPGGGRSGVAVEAGIWTAGEAVPAFANGSSIAYDGQGNRASDWSEQTNPTICAENDGEVCEADGGVIATEDPTDLCVGGDDAPDVVNFTVEGSAGSARAWIATDENGVIEVIQDNGSFDFSDLPSGTNLSGQPGASLTIIFRVVKDGFGGYLMQESEVREAEKQLARELNGSPSGSAPKVFPNPVAGDQLQLAIPEANGEKLTVQVTDLTGRLLLERQFDAVYGGEQLTLAFNRRKFPQ